tara:strand:- start:93 stop:749 length:657 start_codon:yes stop_codon:yes gene_type:complete
LLAWLTSALFGARVSGHRLAVCISGELRSAVCSPRTAVRGSGLAAPLETIARLLSQIGERDVFVAIDEPPSASNNANVAEGGTAALRSLAESDARTARLLARIAPISVEHSVQQTEAQYWDEARQALCVKSAAVFQARKLRSCWQRILAREAQLRFAYTHVLPKMLYTLLYVSLGFCRAERVQHAYTKAPSGLPREARTWVGRVPRPRGAPRLPGAEG